MKNLNGKVLFLDRSDINTDEIIPAKHLTEATRDALRPYCFEALSLPGFDPRSDIAGKSVIVTRSNFGCGSSREHAPWVLEANGINLVIASNFSRIFRQNMFNCGMVAASLTAEQIDDIFQCFAGYDTSCTTDLDMMVFTFSCQDREKCYPFELSEFDLALIRAGGWLEYADSKY